MHTVYFSDGEQKATLVKYVTTLSPPTNSVPPKCLKLCLRLAVIVLFFLCLLLYLPIYYSPTFNRKSYEVVVGGWESSVSRDLPLYIVPENDTAVIVDRSFCSSPLPLLIVVCSSVTNVLQRTTIRETWGNFSSTEYKVVFLVGQTENTTVQQSIEMESSNYEDIIQEGFLDSYNNLTLKSVMLLKQVVLYCPYVQYILKCDDDMFVHVYNLLRLVRNLKELRIPDGLFGELICDAKPIQDSSSKWYSPSYMYDAKVYPPYVSGTGYLMDRSAAVKLYEACLQTPFFHLEDVYITGMCAKKAGIKPRDHLGFSYQTRPYDSCIYVNHQYLVTSHRVTPEKMRALWNDLQGKACKTKKTWLWAVKQKVPSRPKMKC